MRIANLVKSFLFPYSHELAELKKQQHRERALIHENNIRIEKMMATLNGEDSWFLRVVHSNVKEEHDVRPEQI